MIHWWVSNRQIARKYILLGPILFCPLYLQNSGVIIGELTLNCHLAFYPVIALICNTYVLEFVIQQEASYILYFLDTKYS